MDARARARAKRSRPARRPRLHNERRSPIIESSGPRNCHSSDRVSDPTTFVQFQPPGTDSEQSRACSPVKGDWAFRDFGYRLSIWQALETEESRAAKSFAWTILCGTDTRKRYALDSRVSRERRVYKLISCFLSTVTKTPPL